MSIFSDFQHFFWGLFPWVMLSRLACRSLGRLSNGFIFSYIPDFGDLIRGVDIFIKTSLGCWGWRSFSCTSCSGRGGDSAVFCLASCTHIHSHCLMLLPLMSRFGKGKPGILRKDDFFPLPPTEVGWWYGHSAIFQMMAWSCEPLIVQC